MKNFYARKNETGEHRQLLSEHLNKVADLSAEFSKYENISRLSGMLHDFGKATSEFQNYLEEDGERGSVVHSLQGAFFADECICGSNDIISTLAKEIVTLVVEGHHGSLKDGVAPDGENPFFLKLARKDDEKYHYREATQSIYDTLPDFTNIIEALVCGAKAEINEVLGVIRKTYTNPNSAQFALGLFVKYIYSCLIDADRFDAYLFEANEQYTPVVADWDSLINIFEENIQKFSSDGKLSQIRQTISNKCKEAAKKHTGIYQLSVPTGGGKTLSSLRFALHHCKEKDQKRIIYVIPYLSIIEQTAQELRKTLSLPEENDIILEHHSGIVLPDEEENQKARKLAASRWDKPIIVTTMVQFLETVMSSRGSDLRKFHHMSDSVIIFDEIQSLPIKTIHLFNEVISFLAKVCNTTSLLCTATQPLLDKTGRKNLLLEENPNLIDCENLFVGIKRTSIVVKEEMDATDFAGFVAEKARENGTCLAIVNTKKSAKEVFCGLKDEKDFEIYHLSTSMCSVHRTEAINKIKDALKNGRKVICVATQLIEAGVDISFSCVVRTMAGLDSVAQAAGRCNRNGESEIPKEVYVIPLKGESLDKLVDIKIGKEKTERVIRESEGVDLLNPEILEQFYKYYFHDRKNIMDYPTKDDKTIYDMLSGNDSGKRNYESITGDKCRCAITHAFHTAWNEFSVIDKNTESVVVLYGEAEKLIEVYKKQPKNRFTKEKIDTIRKLEKYSISLFAWEIEKLSGAIHNLDEETGIKYLDKFHYSDSTGMVFETDPANYML